jgi:hypothetical protein
MLFKWMKKPVTNRKREQKFRAALQKVNKRHGKVLKKLAD